MALVSLGEAARITGKNRTTIFRAMKTGRLSYTTTGNGDRQVDTAELDRVFGATEAHASKSNSTHVALLERQIASLERVCEDLRGRLDEANSERRNVQTQLTALLADRRDPPPPKRRWWQRRVGQ